MKVTDKIFVSVEDAGRLAQTFDLFRHGREGTAVAELEAELGRAEVVSNDELPAGVVTMHSRVMFEDSLGRQREITLVYPEESDPKRGQLSVLSPVGSALLGLRVGQSITWKFPRAGQRKLRVIAVG